MESREAALTDAEGYVLEFACECGITTDGNLTRYFASEKALLKFAEGIERAAYTRGRAGAAPSRFLKERPPLLEGTRE